MNIVGEQKMYYAADNYFAEGFEDSWYVISFTSKRARDAYVRKTITVAARAIDESEVENYGGVKFRHVLNDSNDNFVRVA